MIFTFTFLFRKYSKKTISNIFTNTFLIKDKKGKGKKVVISDDCAKKQRNDIIKDENEQDNPTDSSTEQNMDLLEVPKLAHSRIIKQELF
jgi:hypothetical protein